MKISPAAVFMFAFSAGLVGATENVSLIRLIATPERYDDKSVTVSGVLQRSEEGVASLYVDSGSADVGIYANALVLLRAESASKESFDREIDINNGRYVLVAAVFDAGQPRPKGYSGILRDVKLIRPYPLILSLPEP